MRRTVFNAGVCIMDVAIRDLADTDLLEVCGLLRETITGTYRLNGITNDDLDEFIEEKISGVRKHLQERPRREKYKVASIDDEIVGIGGIYPLCDSIARNLRERSEGDLEIGSLYVKDRFQRRGVAKEIMRALIEELLLVGEGHFYLDCGYASSQEYWKSAFGEPLIRRESYFAKGEHYMIWKIDTERARNLYSR